MTLRLLQENDPSVPMVVGLTVDQYHRMIAQGILREGEPIELLDGLLVRKDRSKSGEDPMTVGHHHAWAVGQLADLNETLKRHSCFMRVQQPVTIQPDKEPEPDGSIIRGSSSDYRDRHPFASDILCVIEVADSSLNQDRTTKQRIYSQAGIGQYVLINLINHAVEVYTAPDPALGRYGSMQSLKPGEALHLPTGSGVALDVLVDQLLP